MNLIYLINEAGEAVISILTVLVVAALVYVLYYTWNKERIRLKQEKAIYIEGLKSKQELQNDITQYVSVFGTAVSFSLLQIEIRGLKDVEAAFGAPEAEKLVVKTAYKILDCLPGNTELARNKENEFIVFIKNTHDASYVYELCSNIISVIEQPISIMGHASVELDSNIGIVMYPIHGGIGIGFCPQAQAVAFNKTDAGFQFNGRCAHSKHGHKNGNGQNDRQQTNCVTLHDVPPCIP